MKVNRKSIELKKNDEQHEHKHSQNEEKINLLQKKVEESEKSLKKYQK